MLIYVRYIVNPAPVTENRDPRVNPVASNKTAIL